MKCMPRNFLWCVFFISIILFFACLTFRATLPWFWVDAPFDKTKVAVALDDVNYDSQNVTHSVSDSIHVNVPPDETLTTISFRFKANAIKQRMRLFQTASDNLGMSAELDQYGRLWLSTAAINKDHSLSIASTAKIAPNEWHTLTIAAWSGHTIRGTLDSIPSMWDYKLEIVDPGINYQLAQIQVGSGYKADQAFLGQINNFKLETKLINIEHRQNVDRVVRIVAGLLFLLASCVFVILGFQALERQNKIEFITFFVLVGFFAAVIFHYILATYWGAAYPQNTFMLMGLEFSDFYVSLLQDLTFAPYTSEVAHAQYFPFAYVFIYPFTKLNIHLAAIVYLVIFSVAMFMLMNFYLQRNITTHADKLAKLKNVFILSFMTYPFLFNIERANIENLVFILVALSFYFYGKERRFLSPLFLAMASAMKLYPLFFAIFYVAERKYFEAIISGILTGLLIIVSLFMFHSSFLQSFYNWAIALSGLENHILSQPYSCIQFNLGLWGLIKYIFIYWHQWPTSMLMQLFKIYHLIAIACLALVVAYVVFVEKITWRRIALLVFAILLFPEMSNDYKLIYIYIPLASFMHEKPTRGDLFYLVLFGLLLIPKNYYVLIQNVSIANLINQAVVLLMSFCIIGSGLYAKYIRR